MVETVGTGALREVYRPLARFAAAAARRLREAFISSADLVLMSITRKDAPELLAL